MSIQERKNKCSGLKNYTTLLISSHWYYLSIVLSGERRGKSGHMHCEVRSNFRVEGEREINLRDRDKRGREKQRDKS